jgi:hypothetical protein
MFPWIGLCKSELTHGNKLLAEVRKHNGQWTATICEGIRMSKQFKGIASAKRWCEEKFSLSA